MTDILIFVGALGVITKSADLAMRYSSRLAISLNMSKHLMGFVIVAILSVLPETTISIVSALDGTPSFGIGTLFGGNIADLTIVFSVILLIAGRNIKIESKILKNERLYLLTLIVPLLLGWDGSYTRLEGLALIFLGILFYYKLVKDDRAIYSGAKYAFEVKNVFYLLGSLVALLVASHLIVEYGVDLATRLSVSPAIIGLGLVSLGTTLPELFFSIKAVKEKNDDMALGDILGTVLTDGVIIIGLIATISPFVIPVQIVRVTGVFMFIAALLLFLFMRSGRSLNRVEGILLFVFYIAFLFTEFMLAK